MAMMSNVREVQTVYNEHQKEVTNDLTKDFAADEKAS